MPTYAELGKEELTTLKTALTEEYETYKAQGLSLNMARGKPGSDQLDLSMPMLDILLPMIARLKTVPTFATMA